MVWWFSRIITIGVCRDVGCVGNSKIDKLLLLLLRFNESNVVSSGGAANPTAALDLRNQREREVEGNSVRRLSLQ